MKPAPISRILLFLLVSAAPLAAQIVYSKRMQVQPSTGMIESKLLRDWYRGSGAVARDPRLIFSCAHVFYENGIWANDYVFHRNYHRRAYPKVRDGIKLRGIRYFSSYTSNVADFGSDSNQAFASDFTVLYGNSNFGTPVGWFSNGAAALRSGAPKQIVGYPAEIDFTGAPGFCYQHSTGSFTRSAYRVRGSFFEFDNVSTGPGNSGGPVFVREAATGKDLLAGMLVSGSRRTAGVVALDGATDALAAEALGLEPQTQTFQNNQSFVLVDGGDSYARRDFPVFGFSGPVESIRFSVSFSTSHRGDLEVYLRSPGGKIAWIRRVSRDSARNLLIRDLNLDKVFKGVPANGTWRLYLRDAVTGDIASFQSASLRITAL